MSKPVLSLSVLLKYLQLALLLSILLYFGKTLFIPLFYGLFIAIVMFPLCRWLEQKKWPRGLAIALCLFIVTILIAALILLFVLELKALGKDWPLLQSKIEPALVELQTWINDRVGDIVSPKENWMQATAGLVNNAGSFLQGTLAVTANTLFTMMMVPVYTALFLYSRGTFVRFLELLAGEKLLPQLRSVLHQTATTYHKYIKGMVLVYLVVGALNSIGLLILGVPHAILFGMLTAIMTIIPYLGILVSALLPISVAWLTTGSVWIAVGVIAVFAFVQYLEANVIFPKIVGAQLNINTWATLVAIIAGGIVWGVSGMILFIPFVAIIKIATDHNKDWEALNTLLKR